MCPRRRVDEAEGEWYDSGRALCTVTFLESVMRFEDAIKELMRIERQRDIVKKSQCSDGVKASLLAQLAEKSQAIQADLGSVQLPQASESSPSSPAKPASSR